MRDAPLNFFKEKNKQQYEFINLAIAEVSKVYKAIVEDTSTVSSIVVSDVVKEILNDAMAEYGYDYTGSDNGYCWVINFESGVNVGTMRKITGWDSETGAFTISIDLDETPNEDSIRISRNLFLTSRNTPVEFYLPDDSYGADVAMTYLPFPMEITPIGTNSKCEVMTLDLTVSAVNKVISDVIQLAEGLSGNRVYHLRVFEDTLTQGKEYCIKDSAYINSISITNEEIKFELESKFNIVDIQLPLCKYNRDFCRFRFKSDECGWSYENQGFYVPKENALGEDVFDYPLVDANSCDHTLHGPNGCEAHNNRLRFGGFPTLITM